MPRPKLLGFTAGAFITLALGLVAGVQFSGQGLGTKPPAATTILPY